MRDGKASYNMAKKAQKAFDAQMLWYYLNTNRQFADTFLKI